MEYPQKVKGPLSKRNYFDRRKDGNQNAPKKSSHWGGVFTRVTEYRGFVPVGLTLLQLDKQGADDYGCPQ